MIKQELIEIKKDLYEALKCANSIHQNKDLRALQEVEASVPLQGRSTVINIQNVNIEINYNIINATQRIDNLIDSMDANNGAAINVIEGFFSSLLNAGVGVMELRDRIAHEYLKFAIKNEGGVGNVAKKIGENRSTLSMFNKRMGRRIDSAIKLKTTNQS